MNVSLLTKLRGIDWDFRGAWTREDIHGLHWYPSAFIPQIAGSLVHLLSEPGQTIFDPFCGCGTTLVEAAKLGRLALGADSNPLAHLISSAKCHHYDVAALRTQLRNILAEAGNRLARTTAGSVQYNNELHLWFARTTLADLAALWSGIQRVDKQIRIFFEACFSNILKSASSQEEHWGWIADNVKPKVLRHKDALMAFEHHCARMIEAIESFNSRLTQSGRSDVHVLKGCRVVKHDMRVPLEVRHKLDAVITSPPYPGVTDYVHAQRLSYYWFGWNLGQEAQDEIGARWKRFRKTQVAEYQRDILQAFVNIDAVLVPGALLGLVIDDTRRTRRVLADKVSVDVGSLLNKQLGYDIVVDDVRRRLSGQRLLDRKGSQNTERIVVLRKAH